MLLYIVTGILVASIALVFIMFQTFISCNAQKRFCGFLPVVEPVLQLQLLKQRSGLSKASVQLVDNISFV